MSSGTSTRGVLRGGGWNAAALLVPQLYVVVISVVAARYLGPTNTGRQSFIAFVELSLVLVLTGGLPFALVRFTGEAVGAGEANFVRGLLRWSWRLVGISAALGAGIMIGAAAFGATPATAWVLAGLFCALAILQTVPAAVLGGLQRWRGMSVTGLATGAISVVAIIVVLQLGGGIAGIFGVEVAITAINLAVTSRLVHQALGSLAAATGPDRSPELERRLARFTRIASLNVLIDLVVWRRSEFFFLKGSASDAQIAIYSIAFAAVAALNQLPEAAARALTPAFANLFGAGDMARIRRGYARSARLLLMGSLPLAGMTVALGPKAIDIVYGHAFHGAGTLVVIMASTLPVLALHALSRGLLGALGHQRILLGAAVVAGVVDLTLAFILIPRHAAVGAAVTNGVAQLVATVPPVVYALRRLRPLPMMQTDRLARSGVATVALILAATFTVRALPGVVALVVGALAGLGAYALLAAGLRIVPRQDAEWLAAMLGGGRLGRAVLRAGAPG